MLQVPADLFVPWNLTTPLDLGRTFDLVMSLEVAEHLPQAAAETFVSSLVGLGPVVLFSAAIPGQQGDHHVNLQWQDWWVEYFERHGYVPVDAVRPEVWGCDDVESWYAQNTLIFVDGARISEYPGLEAARRNTRRDQLTIVHPRTYERALRRSDPGAIARAVVRRTNATASYLLALGTSRLRRSPASAPATPAPTGTSPRRP